MMVVIATCGGPAVSQTTPQTVSLSLGAANQCLAILGLKDQVSGQINAQVPSAFSGIITVQSQLTGGAWATTNGAQPGATLTAAGQINVAPQAISGLRVCVTSYTSGAIYVTLSVLSAPSSLQFDAAAAIGIAKHVIIDNTPLPVVCGTAVSFCAPTPATSVAVNNAPTVVPSCPAAAYPCGLPTPNAPTTSVSANVGTPTVIPSCPASSYPCGLPTPQATPVPCATAAASVCKVDIASQSLTPIAVTTSAPITSLSVSSLPTPSAEPLPTASSGVTAPAAGLDVVAWLSCIFAAGAAPTVTAAHGIATQCDNKGNLNVNLNAQGLSPLVVSTPVPCATPTCNNVVWQGTSPWVVSTPTSAPLPTASAGAAQPTNGVEVTANASCAVPAGATPNVTGGNRIALQCGANGALNVNIPVPTATMQVNIGVPTPTSSATALPAAASVSTIAQMYTITGGVWGPVKGGAGNAGNTQAGQTMDISICNSAGSSCGVPTAAPVDGTSNATVMLPVQTFPMIFNGTTWDRYQHCTTTTSGQTTTATTTEISAAGGAGKVNYLCGYSFSFASGTAVGVKLEYGTKATTACDTGPGVVVNTTLLPATGGVSQFSSNPIFFPPSNNEWCLVSTGSSTPTINWTIYTVQY